jgi:hypothetical protein
VWPIVSLLGLKKTPLCVRRGQALEFAPIEGEKLGFDFGCRLV